MRIWKHVWPEERVEATFEGRLDELDVEVRVGNNAVVRLPAVQRLRLLYRGFGQWRQGSSVHDTVYDTSRDDPDIEGPGTLIGMFKDSNDAWNAVACHNAIPQLVQALVALLDANVGVDAPPPVVPAPPHCCKCDAELSPGQVDDVERSAQYAEVTSVVDGRRYCETCFVRLLAAVDRGEIKE